MPENLARFAHKTPHVFLSSSSFYVLGGRSLLAQVLGDGKVYEAGQAGANGRRLPDIILQVRDTDRFTVVLSK